MTKNRTTLYITIYKHSDNCIYAFFKSLVMEYMLTIMIFTYFNFAFKHFRKLNYLAYITQSQILGKIYWVPDKYFLQQILTELTKFYNNFLSNK